MTSVTEHEVAVAASFMGYDLFRGPEGYLLKREWHNEQEVIEADSLELIAHFLAHWQEAQEAPQARNRETGGRNEAIDLTASPRMGECGELLTVVPGAVRGRGASERSWTFVPKINISKKEDDVLLPMGQKKPLLNRYWLQVDRQTKSSYDTLQEAETAGKAIKTAHPKLQVSIYDAEKSQQTLISS
jgi:hypothetical protein